MARISSRFPSQHRVRGPWRRYLDDLKEVRPQLHRYCCKLAGNVWDGEDLMQDALIRVFSQLGKTDARLENPRAYLIRTATNLWIDRMRRAAREQAALALELAEEQSETPVDLADSRNAASALFERLHPQERAAMVMKDVLDLSLEETAAALRTTVGAVKSALSRGRGRLAETRPPAGLDAPPREIVEAFMNALSARDVAAIEALCSETVSGELVGGVEGGSFDAIKPFFEHAHMVMPALGFGEGPRWELAEYLGEPVVLGLRTLDGVEGLNEVHRLEVEDGKITRVRLYCFSPETIAVVAEDLELAALPRPHRSPTLKDAIAVMVGLRRRPRAAPRRS